MLNSGEVQCFSRDATILSSYSLDGVVHVLQDVLFKVFVSIHTFQVFAKLLEADQSIFLPLYHVPILSPPKEPLDCGNQD